MRDESGISQAESSSPGGIENSNGKACAQVSVFGKSTAGKQSWSITRKIIVWGSVAIGLLILISLIFGESETVPSDTASSASQRSTAPFCDDDCLDEGYDWAEIVCPQYIERRAKYDYEWTDGFLERKFTHAVRQSDGTVRYVGEELKFQNGFGAWQRITYYCDLDVKNEIIVRAGVLDL